jgi:hypothetical protein
MKGPQDLAQAAATAKKPYAKPVAKVVSSRAFDKI